MLEFSVSREMGPRWLITIAALGIVVSFVAGLSNSTMFYATLPKDENAEVIVFYQPTCPHCIAEIPTIKKIIADGHKVSAFNVFKHQDLARKYGVTETPTIVVPRNGTKLVGEQSYESILAAIHGTQSWQTTAQQGAGCSVNPEAITCSRT